jgi:hypothetical protein
VNWLKAKKRFSCGIVEGLNNKAKLTMRKSYPAFLTNPVITRMLARVRPLKLQRADLPVKFQ